MALSWQPASLRNASRPLPSLPIVLLWSRSPPRCPVTPLVTRLFALTSAAAPQLAEQAAEFVALAAERDALRTQPHAERQQTDDASGSPSHVLICITSLLRCVLVQAREVQDCIGVRGDSAHAGSAPRSASRASNRSHSLLLICV